MATAQEVRAAALALGYQWVRVGPAGLSLLQHPDWAVRTAENRKAYARAYYQARRAHMLAREQARKASST
jgi:hypothetical protein